MRDDQYVKLKSLRERLIDHFIEEGDPVNWPGHGIPIAKQDAKDRGDAVWCKKSAAATLGVAARIGAMLVFHEHHVPPDDGVPAMDDDDTERASEREIAAVAREATAILDRVRNRAR